jgi:hypothetical protein
MGVEPHNRRRGSGRYDGRLALFAYGSLASPASAALTLGRPVEVAALARLEGWRRRWSVCRDNRISEKTFAPAGGGAPYPWCLGLNIERTGDSSSDRGAGSAIFAGPNGALIEVSETELDRIDLRELRYDRTEVTDDIAAAGHLPDFTAVYAWTAKPRHHYPTPPDGAVIIATYHAAVERAFAELGNGQLELFRATTEPPPVKLADGVLVRDRIPVGNPREW